MAGILSGRGVLSAVGILSGKAILSGDGVFPAPSDVDPLLSIAGLSTWRRTEGLFQEPALTTPADEGDPVGGWKSNTDVIFAQPDGAQKFTLTAGWVQSDNTNDLLGFIHTRTSEYTAIARIKIPPSGVGGGRIFGVNYTLPLLQGNNVIALLNEAVAVDPAAVHVVATDQIATLRMVRESPTLVKLWLDGTLISTLSGAQAADGHGDIRLVLGGYAGFAYADRILTPEELELVETTLSDLDP